MKIIEVDKIISNMNEYLLKIILIICNFYDITNWKKLYFLYLKYNCDSFYNKYYINDNEKIDFEICDKLKKNKKFFGG